MPRVEVGSSTSQGSRLGLEVLHDLAKFDHELDCLVLAPDVGGVLDLSDDLVLHRWLPLRLVLFVLSVRVQVAAAALTQKALGIEAEDERDDLSIVGLDQLVYRVNSLVVDVSGHHCVFEELKPVVHVNLFLNPSMLSLLV